MKEKEFGLYIHIPFCMRKCSYCDFLSKPASFELQEKYVKALIKEIRLTKEKNQGTVKSIYFGGGTPSILEPYQMQELMDTVLTCFSVQPQAEISMEINPGILKREKLTAYRKSGINRLSIGLQSTQNKELRQLGRIHTYEEFEKNYQMAREEGFANINVDLMLAIPFQTKSSLKLGLQQVIKLYPDHISVYSLIIEEGTPFYEQRECLDLPNEEIEREMYWLADEYLEKNGYHAYEISNYALTGKECRHNLIYWSDEDYIGLGIGAASYWEGVRYNNTENIEEYVKNSIPEHIRKITQPKNEQKHLEEYLFLGLRKRKGLELKKLNELFRQPLQRLYSEEMKRLLAQDLVEMKDGFLRLTKKGIDFSNLVFAEFLRSE